MSRKVAVIGMGHVGSTVAHYIVANGFADDLVLIDSNEDKVNADALDLKDAMPNLPYHTNICLLYTSPSPRDRTRSRMPSSA